MLTQSVTDLESYLDHLAEAGVAFEVSDDLARDPDQPGRPHANGDVVRDLVLEGLPPIREHRDPARTLSACHATRSVARAMARNGLVRAGKAFWDVGCGTGVLAIVARLLGAGPVYGTDVDPDALALAARNVEAAGIDVTLGESSLLERGFDMGAGGLVAANLPHKPSRGTGVLPLSQDGGPEGDRLFAAMLDQVDALGADTRLLFFLHSLPHPRLLARIGREHRLVLRSWKRRFLEPGEYGTLNDWFLERHAAGTSYVGTTNEGRHYLVCGVWVADPR